MLIIIRQKSVLLQVFFSFFNIIIFFTDWFNKSYEDTMQGKIVIHAKKNSKKKLQVVKKSLLTLV